MNLPALWRAKGGCRFTAKGDPDVFPRRDGIGCVGGYLAGTNDEHLPFTDGVSTVAVVQRTAAVKAEMDQMIIADIRTEGIA